MTANKAFTLRPLDLLYLRRYSCAGACREFGGCGKSYVVEQIFQSLVTGTLIGGALFLVAMVECQIRAMRGHESAMSDRLKDKLSIVHTLAPPNLEQLYTVRGYDSPELFRQDELVRREKKRDLEN